jgi:hypothetical protein
MKWTFYHWKLEMMRATWLEDREFSAWKAEKRERPKEEKKDWQEPSPNWSEFELILRYGRRWKKLWEAWKKKARTSRLAQPNPPGIDSMKAATSVVGPPEIGNRTHSPSNERDELEREDCTQTDGDSIESDSTKEGRENEGQTAADDATQEPLLGNSSADGKSGGTRDLQANANRPAGESDLNPGDETDPQTRSLCPSLSGHEAPDRLGPSMEGTDIETLLLDVSTRSPTQHGALHPPETDLEVEKLEKEKQEEEQRKKDKEELMAWLREARKEYHSPRHYEFLGECYIHGMMDGEAMASQNNEGLKTKVFELR